MYVYDVFKIRGCQKQNYGANKFWNRSSNSFLIYLYIIKKVSGLITEQKWEHLINRNKYYEDVRDILLSLTDNMTKSHNVEY